LTAIAKAQRKPGTSQEIEPGRAQKLCAAAVIVESAADQPWAEFCRALKRPAFLLADNSFAELKQP
jgi:hypothetical protein